mgnify:CR=1 FL=1
MTLSVAVLISLLVSLDHDADDVRLRLIRRQDPARQGALLSGPASACSRRWCTATRARCSGRCATGALLMVLLAATVVFNVYLYVVIPEGLLPAAGHRARSPAASRPTRAISLPVDVAEADPVHEPR